MEISSTCFTQYRITRGCQLGDGGDVKNSHNCYHVRCSWVCMWMCIAYEFLAERFACEEIECPKKECESAGIFYIKLVYQICQSVEWFFVSQRCFVHFAVRPRKHSCMLSLAGQHLKYFSRWTSYLALDIQQNRVDLSKERKNES